MSSIQHQLRLLTAEIALSTLESRVYLRLIGICGESSEAEAEAEKKIRQYIYQNLYSRLQ